MKERDLTNKYLEVGELIQRGRRAALKAGVVGLGASAFTMLGSSLLTPSVALGRGQGRRREDCQRGAQP
ncbi:hypothetical protein J8C01_01395 [Chloracidobacterium sp. D]|uniref:hypothetical protein n=1 Tax=Chloracidobacterium sp. D TaxID=2821536 RepID=UPI001B8CA387|nr:hypothetical protein [Chloracidobacterium sp. D]QUV82016.1 hypothetical protein J8C01_01395 [Chloracidobacterium sp. D]